MESGFIELRAAAARLHMDANELKHFAQRGEVPSQNRGDTFWFEPRLLDEWAQRRTISISPALLAGEHAHDVGARAKTTGEVRIADLVAPDAVAPFLGAKNRAGVLRDMAELADAAGKVYDKSALFKGLCEREDAASTAVGGGAAFLHMKYHDEYIAPESFIAVGRTVRPVFFGAPDDAGTDLFFLIVCTDRALHLHVLARLCLLAHGTPLLEDLRVAESPGEMLAAIRSAEDGFFENLRR